MGKQWVGNATRDEETNFSKTHIFVKLAIEP